MTAHEVFDALVKCYEGNRPWELRPADAGNLLAWARDLTERSNETVRENHRLSEALRTKQ